MAGLKTTQILAARREKAGKINPACKWKLTENRKGRFS